MENLDVDLKASLNRLGQRLMQAEVDAAVGEGMIQKLLEKIANKDAEIEKLKTYTAELEEELERRENDDERAGVDMGTVGDHLGHRDSSDDLTDDTGEGS